MKGGTTCGDQEFIAGVVLVEIVAVRLMAVFRFVGDSILDNYTIADGSFSFVARLNAGRQSHQHSRCWSIYGGIDVVYFSVLGWRRRTCPWISNFLFLSLGNYRP